MTSPIDNQVRVAIADDHAIFRDGLKMVLSKAAHIKLTAEAANGRELLALITKDPPDVVITDIKMPEMDGVAVTRYLSQHLPRVGVIALSMFDEDALITEMLNAGAISYLLKNSDKEEILEAVARTARHEPYYCRHTSMKLAKIIAQRRYNEQHIAGDAPALTEKEQEIVRLICAGYTARQIGQTIFMSERTVEGYRRRILEKMGVPNTVGLVIAAIRMGIYAVA